MTIEEAEKIEEILNRYRKLQKLACDFQDVTHLVDEFTITTKNGSITIPKENHSCFGNSVLFEIDVMFGDWLDKIEAELNEL